MVALERTVQAVFLVMSSLESIELAPKCAVWLYLISNRINVWLIAQVVPFY